VQSSVTVAVFVGERVDPLVELDTEGVEIVLDSGVVTLAGLFGGAAVSDGGEDPVFIGVGAGDHGDSVTGAA
jgi:hypothetical protein